MEAIEALPPLDLQIEDVFAAHAFVAVGAIRDVGRPLARVKHLRNVEHVLDLGPAKLLVVVDKSTANFRSSIRAVFECDLDFGREQLLKVFVLQNF